MATQAQSEQMNMFQTVEDCVKTNSIIFFKIPGFEDRYKAFVEWLKQIFQINEELTADGSGTSSASKQLRTKLEENTYSISSKIAAYALHINNQPLMNEINFTKTDLKACNYQNLVSLGELTFNRATALITELTPYNLKQAVLDDYRILLDESRKSIPSVRENINKKASSGKSMSQLISNNHTKLGEMDTLAEVIRETDAKVYMDYKKARKVIKLPSRRKAVVGKITLAGGTTPVKGASISFYLNDDQSKTQLVSNAVTVGERPILTKMSAEQGGFRVDSLSDGMYRVEIVKPGYQKQVIMVAISNSETAKIEVEMVKL